MVGRKLSHYEIVDEVSRGGMGVVYRAIDLNLGREVAVKVLPEDLLHDPARRERLLQEARAASALEHPHVAVIHEVGDADGVTFIAMELIRGEKLSEVVARGPLPLDRALALATEIGEGLARAHEKGIVHRDLKPANVMVTSDGHAKIIDFGLAKLLEPIGHEAATASMRAPRTDAGVILGTAAYMSPEQARGGLIDHRSDIFALGVTLYEMITGRPAFQGQSSLDTMQAILTQPAPPLPARAGAPSEVTAELQRIVNKCTAKDPDDRYQGMKDLVVDVRAARRRLESAPTGAVTAIGARRLPAGGRTWLVGGLAVAILAAAVALGLWMRRLPPSPASPSGKPAVAVLYFENNTGDPSLDWMRTGLTDMVVTDLSQSREIEVIGTDRLVQILQEMGRADDRVISADVVQAIAERAAVDNVLVGSYVRAGNTIRISARLQEARTGRILTAERVEGAGDSGLFALVDELTRRFRSKMAELGGMPAGPLLPRPGEASEHGLDRGLEEVTTSSIEAYRYYSEGLNFHERGLPSQAVPLLEKAIEIDPDFAMAHAKLAVVAGNTGQIAKAEQHSARALALVDRLTTRERYYIEGYHYSLRPETRERSIAAYTQALALHPEHHASRHNLGLELIELERFPEAIEHYNELLRRGTSNPTTYENLADMLIQTGDVRRAREVADQFVSRYPDNAAGLRMQGMVLVADGRLDEALAAFEKSGRLNPLDFIINVSRRSIAVLQHRWNDAERITGELVQSRAPFERFVGLNGAGQIAAARGRSAAALDFFDQAARVEGIAPTQRAQARNRQATILLRARMPQLALAQAQLAWPDARGRNPELETLQLRAVALAALRRTAESLRALEQLEARARTLGSPQDRRRVHWTRGEIALLRGDAATAADELRVAQELLPRHGPPTGPPSDHGDLWLAAATAAVAAGRDADAAPLLERLQAGHERAFALDAYTRSFFLLGQIYERRGDAARARDQYARFVELRGDGDSERASVEAARKKLR